MITETKTRAEHVAWCKKRALEILERGDRNGAWTSFASDMRKHEGTMNHIGLDLGTTQLALGMIATNADLKKYIEDFS